MKNALQDTSATKITLKQYVIEALSSLFAKREESKSVASDEEKEEKKEEWNYFQQLMSL